MHQDDWDVKAQPPPVCYAGICANAVAAADDDLYVRLPGADNGRARWGPVRWAPRVSDAGNALYPDESSSCLVVKSDDGEYWVLMWWPYD